MTPAADRRSFQLVLVDEDPLFRSGLRICLEDTAELQIVAEAETGAEALQLLDTFANRAIEPTDYLEPPSRIDLVIIDLELGRRTRDAIQGLDLCRRIRVQYPDVAVLLLSAVPEPIMLAAAQRVGANGYCARNLEANELIAIIRRVATGQPYWMRLDRSSTPSASPATAPLTTPSASTSRSRRPWLRFRRNLRISGLQQIETALAETAAQLRSLDLSDLDRALLAGRRRELLTARWLVKRFLATPALDAALGEQPQETNRSATATRELPVQSETESTTFQATGSMAPSSAASSSALAPSSMTSSSLMPQADRDVRSILFDAISAKLQLSLTNGTETPLEIDILREDKKRELFYLVLRKLEDLLDELRFSQVDAEQLTSKRSLLLLDLWQAVVIDFFGKYSTLTVDGFEVEIVDEILQDMSIVQTEILDKIPSVVNLFQHLLFQLPLMVDGTPYPPGNPASLARAEWLLENLMIQVANAVIQPLLNRFANVEAIKQSLYNRRLLSSREIERFRNNLSWKYRLEKYVREPTNIFESRYSLFVLAGRGIKKTSIYAPRHQELQQLSGVPMLVTMVLETRDAVAPRVRSVISFMGNGVIYVLTEVIGRGIGLVGRGVIKGIGSVWQDGRFR
jgi:DNA-binding NarL/FixJ family response regulator